MSLRIATHVHSDWSYDGRWALADLSRAFARRGYDAVLTAEHDKTFDDDRWEEYRAACADASRVGALLVPGLEYSDAANRVHVPVWGVDEFLGRERDTLSLLLAARAAGGVAVIAHPARRDAWRALTPECLRAAHGIEVWNRKYDGWAPCRLALDLAREEGLQTFVGLDFHSSRQFFPLAMLAPGGAPSAERVYVALREGTVRPVAARLPASRFSSGRGLQVARAGEHARRELAPLVRRVAKRQRPVRRQ